MRGFCRRDAGGTLNRYDVGSTLLGCTFAFARFTVSMRAKIDVEANHERTALASADAKLKERTIPYLRRVRDEFRIPMLYVTHDG